MYVQKTNNNQQPKLIVYKYILLISLCIISRIYMPSLKS